MRTLSKGYSLAGLRFGYGLGTPRLIETLDKARDSYNTDILSQAAATAALSARDEVRKTWEKVIAERARLTAALREQGFTVAPSQSNFVLATPPAGGLSAQAMYRALYDRAIFVRYWDAPRLHDKLRITVGTPEQNDALLGAIDELSRAGAAGAS
ncbi:aminotransferase class I/II-fold pyridoxal phosphate-dependent enzyme [Sorangium sp. So ce1128]